MKFYFAGSEIMMGKQSQLSLLIDRALLSYFYITKIIKTLPAHWDIFIDSGAFSAHSLGKPINHDEYINFIKQYKFKTYASLDSIGNAKQTKANYLKEREAGLNPIPCFHFGEPFEYLEYYMRETDYIALGGIAKKQLHTNVKGWLAKCFSIAKDKNIKFHGYGISNINILQDFPFYSSDSSSWSSGNRYGRFALKDKFKGKRFREVNRINPPIEFLDIFKSNMNNYAKHIEMYLSLEKFITDLWTKRGIIWND